MHIPKVGKIAINGYLKFAKTWYGSLKYLTNSKKKSIYA